MRPSYPRSEESSDFSLVLGGPLYQLFLRTQLVRPPLELLRRRIIAFPLITWLPLFLLSMWAGMAWSGVAVPFFYDITTHGRFLVALPLLIAAESVLHDRLKPLVGEFINRGIITPDVKPRFDAAVASTVRLRNSVFIEISLLIVSFTLGHYFWSQTTLLKVNTWYAFATPEGMQLTKAGLWYAWVSMPIFQFILFRLCYRWFLWMRFLWQISRLPLHLLPMHPDRAGGLEFLANSAAAFSLILTAQGAMLAAVIAGKYFLTEPR